MSEQVGWRGVWRGLQKEMPCWARDLPQLPRLMYRALKATPDHTALLAEIRQLTAGQQRLVRWNRALCAIVLMLAILLFLWTFPLPTGV